MSDTENVDLVVAGAGMVGSLFALRLLRDPVAAGLRVAVIDAEAPSAPAPDAPYALRVSALSPASERFFAEAGLGPALAASRHGRFTDMRVWDADGTGAVHFQAREIGASHLGLLVENHILQGLLTEALFALPQVVACCPDRLGDITRTASGWQLTLASGRRLTTPLLIGADGARSAVRQAAGFGLDRLDYGQQGLVCTVRCQQPHANTAWQRFLPSGPLAFLPLADAHHCSIVWTLPDAEAERLLALPAADFEAALGRAFEHRLGAVSLAGPRAAFPLVATHASHYAGPGVAVIGDAAHTIHPLAGQGVNLGFQDAAVLADELLAQCRAGLALAHERALRRYSRRRRGHNALVMHAMSGFERLFGSAQPGLRVLRNAGMAWFDRSGLLKQQVMRAAMGLDGLPG